MRAKALVLNGSLAVLVVGVGLAGWSKLGTDTAASASETSTTVKRGTVMSSVSATGNVSSQTTVALSFPTAGTVTAINVKVGDKVTKGEILATIDATAANQQLTAAQAQLASAQSNLQNTQQGLTPAEKAQLDAQAQQSNLSISSANQSVANAQASAANDTRAAQLSVDQAQSSLDAANAQANQDAVNAQTSVDQASAALAADQASLAAAQAQLATDTQTLADATGSAVAAAKQAVDADQASVNQLEAKVSADTNAVTNAKNQQASTKLKDQQSITQAQNQLATARQSLASTKLKDSQAVTNAEQQVATARAGLAATQAGNQVKLAPATQAQLDQAQASVVQAQNAVATATTAVNNTQLEAPFDGVVATVNGTVGLASNAGSGSGSSASSSGFITLVDASHLVVKAPFSESDAAKVKVGQSATVTLDALSGASYGGKVVSVDPTSTTSNNVVTYGVTVALDNPDAQVKPGMTAQVTVVIDHRDDVLFVPSTAVQGRGQNTTVLVKKGDQTESVPVVVGLRGDNGVEITSGLAENEPIVIRSQSAGTGSLANATRLPGAAGGALTGGGGFGGGGRG